MKGINVLSLFDGIGCGKLALEMAGIEVDNYFASEIDTYAIQVANYRHPDIIQLGDVKTMSLDLPHIDLMIGGTPCQGFSANGHLEKFEDPRSKLFFDYVAIKDYIQPDVFLAENVKMDTESNKIYSSYIGAEPVLINSALVSAQSRNRLYWSNREISQPDNLGIDVRDIVTSGTVVPEVSTNFKGVRKARCIMCTESSINYTIACRRHSATTMVMEDDFTFRNLNDIERERLQTLPDNYTLGCSEFEAMLGGGLSHAQRLKCTGNGWTAKVIAHIFKEII